MALQTKTLTANGARGYHKFTLIVNEESTSTTNNTSTLSFTFKIAPIQIGYNWSSHSTQKYTITIGSKTYSGTLANYNGSSTVTICSESNILIDHSSDGSKSITIGFVYDDAGSASYTPGDANSSATMILTNIARASIITSASSITLGNACNIKWTPASSSFKYKIKFSLGNWNHTTDFISPAKTSAYTYTGYTISGEVIADTNDSTIYGELPSSTSGTMKATLYTYNSSDTQIGSTSSKNFTVTIPSSIKPEVGEIELNPVNITLSNGTSVNLLVQGKNKLEVKLSDYKAGAGSTIKSYSFSGPSLSKTVTTSETSVDVATSGTISSYGTLTYTVKVTDARGRTNSSTAQIECYEYFAPSFKSFKAFRCYSDKTLATDGKYVLYSYATNGASVNSTNTRSTTIYYKKNSESTVYTASENPFGLGSDGNTVTATVWAEVTDLYGGKSTSSKITIPGTSRIFNIAQDGTGVAVGRFSSGGNLFECGWDASFEGNVSLATSLPIESGGTGASTSLGAEYNINGGMGESTTETGDDTPLVFKKLTPSESGGVFYYKKASNLWDYIAKKIRSIFGFSSNNVLPIANGGTGGTTANEASYNILGNMNEVTTAIGDTSPIVCRYMTPSASSGVVYTKEASLFWNYIASKMGSTSLYSGTLSSGSTTFTYGDYTAYVIKAIPYSSSDPVTMIIPKKMITTTATAYQMCDNQYWVGFKISYSDSTVTLTHNGGSSGAAIKAVYGLI